ncbi:helix-turn-helix transcriptional regulator [Nitrosomonas sp.]|uniref:helix-turn-helix domain-containing protein n=1 Tax=Nitrosomonas sp. TaxID=42353 RepID=UPI002731273C|nr:helix-turn-helix transcriptional regulator [Nitrosomonas sp.]MDP1788222.1 helix-turn-helix transcriptional regulator [Nitrosomonas sp.]
MDMKNYIEEAEKKAGTQRKLAEILGITTRYINMAKNKERCLSVDTCIVLADYIKRDRLEVIAASNLATEKNEKKRKILESCFSTAASVTAAAIVISILTLPLQKPVNAGVLNSEFTNLQIIGN